MTGRETRVLACLAMCAVALATHHIQAQESHPALHWSRAENAADCVDPRTLAELVETYTGPVLVAPASADASIESTIERTGPEEFRLRVSVTLTRGRPAGQRVLTLPAADCRKLDGAIAFVIASTLDPDLGRGALPADLNWLGSERPAADELRAEIANAPQTEPRSKSPPTAAAPVPDVPRPSDAAARDRKPVAQPRDTATQDPKRADLPPSDAAARAERVALQPSDAAASSAVWELGYALAIGRGRVPTATVGALISVARTFNSWFGVALDFRGNANVGGFDVEAGRSVDVNTFDSALLACGRTGRAQAYGFQGCLGPAVGFFSAHGNAFNATHTVAQPLVGGQLKLEASYEIADRISLTAAGLLDLGGGRPAVTYRILQMEALVFRTQLWGIQGAIGLKHTF